MKRFLSLLFMLLLALLAWFPAPAYADSDDKFAAATEVQVQAIQAKFGNPAILNGRDFLTAKEMYEYRDKAGFSTYSYIKDLRGRFHCLGLSVGYPIPASVQISNPKKFVDYTTHGRILVLPQAEPNGLFMPDGLDATYQKFINPFTGAIDLGYVEDRLNTFPYELPNAATSCAAFKRKQ